MGQAFQKICPESQVLPFTADAAITLGAVVVQGAGDLTCKMPTAADPTGGILGVALESAAAAKDRVSVAGIGAVVPCTASAAIARGDKVTVSGTDGRIKTAAPAVGANVQLVGIAMQSAAGAGEKIGVLITLETIQG